MQGPKYVPSCTTQLRVKKAQGRSQELRKRPVCHVLQPEAQQTQSKIDIDSPYLLQEEQVTCYRQSGFVKLPNVFDAATLAHYTPTMSLEVANADKTPLEADSDYQKAFTQVHVAATLALIMYLV